MNELRRLIVRHRHVAPLVAGLLAGTDAEVTILDADGETIIDRGGGYGETFPIAVEGMTIGTVHGARTARAVAAVLSYAAARERDKRSLANEALERYRELALIYDLAESLGGRTSVRDVVALAAEELARLPGDPHTFVVLLEGQAATAEPTEVRLDPTAGIVGGVVERSEAELVEDATVDPRASAAERSFRAIVAAPLRADGRVVGALGALSATAGAFRSADLKVVSAIAALTGPAVGWARRHEASLLHRTGQDADAS